MLIKAPVFRKNNGPFPIGRNLIQVHPAFRPSRFNLEADRFFGDIRVRIIFIEFLYILGKIHVHRSEECQ
jgi:hypothetical protein